MANVKISALPAATAMAVADLLPIVQGGVTKQATGQLIVDLVGLPRGYIDGCVLSNGTDADHDINVAAGVCRDSTNAANIVVAAITKQLDAPWSVGTNAGGLDTGEVEVNKWYHVHVIKATSDGSSDALFSLSADSPALPDGYDCVRRVGAIYNDSTIRGFYQLGDDFMWKAGVTDHDGTTVGTTAQLLTFSVPLGVVVSAYLAASFYKSAATPLGSITCPACDDVNTASGLWGQYSHGAVASGQSARPVYNGIFLTNTSAQLRVRASVDAVSVYAGTVGWKDTRGKE